MSDRHLSAVAALPPKASPLRTFLGGVAALAIVGLGLAIAGGILYGVVWIVGSAWSAATG